MMEPTERIAIVVCTHRWVNPLDRCLASLQAVAQSPQDVIFIDNGSREVLYDWAEQQFPAIRRIRLPENRLFCGGYNTGLQIALDQGYDYILLVNADTEVVNFTFLKELLEAAHHWPRGAFFGPQVYWRHPGIHQNTCLSFPHLKRMIIQWIPWRLFPGGFLRAPQVETPVDFLNGVCVLCRAKALFEIGLMDPLMGGYMEDADWAWRAGEKGWQSIFVPVPSIIHHEATEGYEPYSLKTFLLKRNMVFWFLKIGDRSAARHYVYFAAALAAARRWTAISFRQREAHRFFWKKLSRAWRGLLHGEPLGEWFGPPLAEWSDGGKG